MQEKSLIGFVIYNKHNQFLFTRTIENNIIDYGLVSKEIIGEINQNQLTNIIKQNLCLNVKLTSKNTSILLEGMDTDGKFIIYALKLDTSATSMYSIVNNKTEFLWLSYNQINKLFIDKKINTDQLSCISKCYEQIKTENSLIKEKINKHNKPKSHKETNHVIYSNPDEEYAKYVEKNTDSRLFSRLINGRTIKPCGKECHEQGYLIAQNWHHGSFVNFTELMNDEEFILSAAEITPNPVECGNYFYMYVNPYLKAKESFRLKFLKQVYLNLNVYKLEDINLIVEELNLQNENEIILNDLEFKKLIEKKFEKALKNMELKYNCSGTDKKELHKYKVKANELKVLLDNIKNGLTEIVNSFKVGEKIEEPNFEPSTFYEYLCQQTFKQAKPEEKLEENEMDNIQEDDYTPTNFYEYLCKQAKHKNNNGFNPNF